MEKVNENFVTAAKPNITGSVHVAPKGTKLPTDATTSLDAAFKSLGYVSEDGFTIGKTVNVNKTKAWGGAVVDSNETEKTETLKIAFIESMNPEVLKLYYGSKNVTGDISTGLGVVSDDKEAEEMVLVIDSIMKGNVAKRTVIERAKIESYDDVVNGDTQVVKYGATFTLLRGSDGAYHHEYLKAAAVAAASQASE